ncbi:AAA family ATPase [Stackebrandtia soli]|uniref:AAA family ATPase n=1 Tax=Stackebrandtia soli TaxID=1892856 RepID=UPI0039EAE9EF
MDNRPSLRLAISLRPAALDARRGIVRLHPEVLAALGLQQGDPVRLRGNRESTGIALAAEAGAGRGAVHADDLMLGNLGARDGDVVDVEPVALSAARHVVVAGPPEIVAAVSTETLRLALMSKVVSTGDDVSLLPLDIGGAERDAIRAARRSLSNTVGLGWTTVVLTIADADPHDAIMITTDTRVTWANTGTRADRPAEVVRPSLVPAPPPVDSPPVIPLDIFAGPRAQAEELRELLDLGFHHRDVLSTIGTAMTLGILLTGPAGTGKSTMARTVAAAVDSTLHHVHGPDVAALAANDGAAVLSRAVAALRGGDTLLVTGVEELAPKETTTPVSTVFRRLMRTALGDGNAVICTTADPQAVSPNLRQPGLLEHEIGVPMPDVAARRALLAAFTAEMPLTAEVRLDDLAARSPGYVAADLVTLVREAAVRAAMRAKDGGSPEVGAEDFASALTTVRPSSMADSSLELAPITLDDVGGMEEVKQTLTESVLWPLTYPDTFTRLGIEAPRGVLLYGPPGCGKTFLVKAIAGTGKSNVLSVKGAELLTKWVGESEAAVRDLFRRARQAAPTLIFFDELDALAPVRGGSTDGGTADRVVAALLTELDGVESLRNVVVIGATNRPDMIDPALLRPGRLERLVYVPPPDGDGRAAILRSAAKGVPLADDVDLDALGAELDHFSAADCAALIREAALSAMRESVDAASVTAAHVADARTRVRPSLNPVQLAELAAYADRRA